MNDVAQGVGRETGPDIGKNVVKIASAEQAQRAKEQVADLLAGPLSADTAVQVAFLNNRDLQAAYNDLGNLRGRLCAGEPAAQSRRVLDGRCAARA